MTPDEIILALIDYQVDRLTLDWEIQHDKLVLTLAFKGKEISAVFIPLKDIVNAADQ